MLANNGDVNLGLKDTFDQNLDVKFDSESDWDSPEAQNLIKTLLHNR